MSNPVIEADDGGDDYQRFVESMAVHCNCEDKPCDGVLAGGLCDEHETKADDGYCR